MDRKKLLAMLAVSFLLGAFAMACASGGETTAEEASTFNPIKIAEKGAMSIYLVHDNVPCVVFKDIVGGGGGIGMSCDFSRGSVLKGLR